MKRLQCEHARVPTRLGYAILFVSDLDRAIGFYRDVIGVPLRLRADAYAEFATAGAKFALFPRSELSGFDRSLRAPGSGAVAAGRGRVLRG